MCIRLNWREKNYISVEGDCAKTTYFSSINVPLSLTNSTWDSWPSQYVGNYRKGQIGI